MNIEAKFRGGRPLDRELRPVVALPRSGIPGLAIALIAILIAIVLFFFLNGRRNETVSSTQQEGTDTASFAAAPSLVLPAPAQSAPQLLYLPAPRPLIIIPTTRATRSVTAPFASAQREPYFAPPLPAPSPPGGQIVSLPSDLPPPSAPVGSSEPALLGDIADNQGTNLGAIATGGPALGGSSATRSGETPAVRPTRLANSTNVMPTGTLIPGVLETPIDTSRPGLVRAIVSKDARGFDGRRVLVPRGSRLIGEFRGDVPSGQSRVLVNWTSLVRPDGVVIKLDSPAADALGGSGVPGTLHSYFLERFLGSAFQSALGVGQAILGARTQTTVVVGLPGSAGNVAQVIGATPGPQPKITVKAGALINVFVAHDLDFSDAPPGR
jgi:type IV secretion system protein VirB10